ncbi:SRPBCC family protein [Acidiferrimicrobium sp. IK]|uniref:SRPBCC family protein n=1 Tax=Acidiferrimicrobium sp. IK TaxID=2871700 RepID=UPI0021CB1672|nr:SRPBCC family protein [Acidiferrimicrobium sp. IK]MCU4187433.1 SRPBCC family protein [Acidiferrimicrobium sp. IK]
MAKVGASVEIDATPEETWDAAVDWPGQRHWVLASSVRATSGGGRGVNATLEARTGFGPLSLSDPMEIVEWDPPHRLVLRHVGPFVRGDAIYKVTRLADGRSKLEWSEVLEAPGALLSGVYAVGVPLFGLMIKVSLHRFARWVPKR